MGIEYNKNKMNCVKAIERMYNDGMKESQIVLTCAKDYGFGSTFVRKSILLIQEVENECS